MGGETEKKDLIEKLVNEWYTITQSCSRFDLDWKEEEIKEALRAKAYEVFGISQ
jgi:hypothetical protein